MKTTSHFVGIALKSKNLASLFIEIHNILWENTEKIVELQNPLSPHITLYYLPKELSKSDQKKIKQIISEVDVETVHTEFSGLHYFRDTIAYVWYKNCTVLEQINAIFRRSFPEYAKIPDNAYPIFTPHTTLFKIKDQFLYQKYREEIEKSIQNILKNIHFEDIYDTVSLYAVNSTFSPELQVALS